MKPKGWRGESKRHSMARRGIKTAQKMPKNLLVRKDRYDKRIDSLQKALTKNLKFPYEHKYPKNKDGSQTSQYFLNGKEIQKEINRQKNYQKGLDQCFACGRWTRKGSSVRQDKREAGDGLMGSIFICDTCSNQY